MRIKKLTESRYQIDQSPLYKLCNKRKLASLFGVTLPELKALLERSDNYRVFSIHQDNGKARRVETPKPILERIHRRLFVLISRIEPPSYLHSGVKGRSYVTNAKSHCGYSSLYKLDIEKYYPSTKGWHVFQFFREHLKCSPDAAGLLTKICLVEDHIPTGSPLSQALAFYSHINMFEELNTLANKHDLVMTCYVDDISFSGNSISQEFKYLARQALKRRGLNSKSEKEKVFFNDKPRVVTGVVVAKDGVRIASKQHHKLKQDMRALKAQQKNSDEWKSLYAKIQGRLISSSQVTPRIRNKVSVLHAIHQEIE